ncbi:Alpha/Beta hydrolase protein [Achaetomium macrosporum]|uniref:Alpha/Beta hydrolase protein n=1 Tax=Achaetomium macrosporum TaxID=79813 RepID=A0AAN7H864_9PEZI|nr:Alpha/Beta hydrolase protein [Achaetomium macrosporum]
MKGLLFACLSLVSLAVGAPSLRRQDAVTPQLLNNFELFIQWSVASSCNSEKSSGEPVTCNQDQCSRFVSHNATVVDSFIGAVLDTRGFVGVDPVDGLIVLSFRGSSSIENWIADFLFLQVPCDLTPNCLVHDGFYLSWSEVRDRAMAAVSAAKAANPTYPIVVTGHSLGGAIATLAAAYMRAAGFAADLYTYGSPRVGNLALAEFVTNQPGAEYRVTHTDDPVPRLPPIWLNYRHVSPEYWVDPGSDGVATANEIAYCPGYSNVDCNGGTTGLDVQAHLWYFQEIDGCDSNVIMTSEGGMSKQELEAKLNQSVEMDKQVAENLHAEGQE